MKRLLIYILTKFLQNEETKEERNLRLGYDLLIEYDSNIKKGIKNKHYSKEETDLIILAISDRFKPIKDYRTRSHL